MMRGMRRILMVSCAALLLLVPSAGAKTKHCKDASLVPTAANQSIRLQRATRCLINRERTKRGLKAMKADASLQKSADFQAGDMLKYEYFDHSRPGGPEFAERILRFGYAKGADGYLIGENIAWASASIASPKQLVKMWMHSPPHRKNILTREFRDQAVSALWSDGGVGGAYAGSGGPFLIYVNQFGERL